MRSFLYSKWFFAFLALVCVANLILELLEAASPAWTWLNTLAVPMDCVAAFLAGWMFIDLHRRKPGGTDGRDPRR